MTQTYLRTCRACGKIISVEPVKDYWPSPNMRNQALCNECKGSESQEPEDK